MADFLEPEKIVQGLDIKAGMTIADFGCGSGYFTIPLAKRVGDTGKVYALDIQRDVLEVVKSRAKTENLLNIEAVWANLEIPGGSKLQDASQDLVIISNILFQAGDKKGIFQEAARVLKPGSPLAVFEWDSQSDPPPGPPKELRIPKQTVENFAKETGLAIIKEIAAGSHHYGILFRTFS